MKKFTHEMLASPLFEKKRKSKGMTPDEFLAYMNSVVAPSLDRRAKLFEEFIKERVSEDGKFITKYDEETGLHITYEIKTGKEVSRKRYEFSV